MPASSAAASIFRRARRVLAALSLSALAFAQTNLGLNPTVNSGSLTLNALDTFTGTLSVGGSGSLLLGADYTINLPLVFTSNGTYLSYTGGTVRTLTLASSASLTRSGAGGYTYVYDNVANSGTVTLSGGTLQFQNGTTLTNSPGATTSVTGSGSTLYLVGLANSGTFNVNSSGLVQLAGAFTTANLGTITTASGGAVQLSGTLNNSSATLSLPAGSALTLYSGTITGGNITSAALTTSSGGGTLDGATVNGNLSLASGDVLALKNGAGATGTTTVNNATLYLASNLSTTAGSSLVFTGANSYLSYNVGSTPLTLTLPTTASLTHSGTGYTYAYDNLTNAGTVTISGGTLQFQNGTTFTNTGTATATGAGSNLYLIGLANSGTLSADTNGVIQLAGAFTTPNLGSLTTTSGGAVQLSGTLTNTSATLSLPTGTALTLSGGTITGGTITSAALTTSSGGGTLDGATVNGNLSLASGDVLALKNGAGATGTTTVNNATLYLASNLSTTAGSSLVFTGANSYLSYNVGSTPLTLTVPASASLTHSGTGYTYAYDNLANAGTVTISGGTLQFQNGTTLTNTGTATATGSGSNLYLIGLTNTGTLTADSGGVLQLAGNFTTAGLGNIAITGATPGTIQITGTLDNTGTTLTPPTGGVYTLNGGTIKNGTITDTAFTQLSGTLDGATVLGNLSITSAQTLNWKNSGAGATGLTTVNGQLFIDSTLSTLNGSTLALTGASSTLNYHNTQPTLTVVANSTLSRSGSGSTNVYTNLANSGNIVVTGGTIFLNANVTNSSALTVSNAGTFSQNSAAYSFTNTGTANVTGAGSTLIVSGLVNPAGNLISDSGGLLQLAGNFTTAGLGNIAATGATPGAVQITGTLDNTGTTLTAPTGGIYTLNGGTIKNGTIVDTAFTQLSGTLDGATVLGNLSITSAQTLNWKNPGAGATNITTVNGQLFIDSTLSTLNGSTLALTGASSTLNYHNTQPTLSVVANSTLSRSGSGSTNVYPNLSNAGNIVVTGGTLFINANVTNSSALAVSNAGTFSQNSAAYSFTNTGTANVTGIGSTLIVSDLINTGALISDSGGLLQLAGNFTTAGLGNIAATGATPGAVQITGTLDNTGTTLTAPTGGIYTLNGGTIKNGTIVDTAFTQLSGTLDGATVLGNLSITSAQTLNWKNPGAGATNITTVNGQLFIDSTISTLNGSTLALTGASSTLNYHNTQPTLTVVANSTLSRSGSGSTNVYPNLANAGNVVVSGGSLFVQAGFTNAANITVAAGATLSNASGLTQTAGTLQVDGQFTASAPGLNISGGSLTGAGNLSGNTTFTSGTLDPGSAIGTLTFTGNLTLTGGATTLIQLGAGTNLNDKVVVSGAGNTLVFGGALDIVTSATTFASGQSWNVFSFTNHSGSFASLTLPNTSSGWVWDTSQLTTTGVLTLTTFVPVPEPSTYVLLASGLSLVFVLRRRAASRPARHERNLP